MINKLLLICYVGIITTKQCSERKSIFFIIDSTNHTSSLDFDVQRNVILKLLDEFQPNKLTVSVKVYDNNAACGDLSTGDTKSLYNEKDTDKVVSKLNSLDHHNSSSRFQMQCVRSSLKSISKSRTTHDDRDTFSVVLAKYESVKGDIDTSLHQKFNKHGRYFLAFLYNASDKEIGIIARRDKNIFNMSSTIMKHICPVNLPPPSNIAPLYTNTVLAKLSSFVSDINTTRSRIINVTDAQHSKSTISSIFSMTPFWSSSLSVKRNTVVPTSSPSSSSETTTCVKSASLATRMHQSSSSSDLGRSFTIHITSQTRVKSASLATRMHQSSSSSDLGRSFTIHITSQTSVVNVVVTTVQSSVSKISPTSFLGYASSNLASISSSHILLSRRDNMSEAKISPTSFIGNSTSSQMTKIPNLESISSSHILISRRDNYSETKISPSFISNGTLSQMTKFPNLESISSSHILISRRDNVSEAKISPTSFIGKSTSSQMTKIPNLASTSSSNISSRNNITTRYEMLTSTSNSYQFKTINVIHSSFSTRNILTTTDHPSNSPSLSAIFLSTLDIPVTNTSVMSRSYVKSSQTSRNEYSMISSSVPMSWKLPSTWRLSKQLVSFSTASHFSSFNPSLTSSNSFLVSFFPSYTDLHPSLVISKPATMRSFKLSSTSLKSSPSINTPTARSKSMRDNQSTNQPKQTNQTPLLTTIMNESQALSAYKTSSLFTLSSSVYKSLVDVTQLTTPLRSREKTSLFPTTRTQIWNPNSSKSQVRPVDSARFSTRNLLTSAMINHTRLSSLRVEHTQNTHVSTPRLVSSSWHMVSVENSVSTNESIRGLNTSQIRKTPSSLFTTSGELSSSRYIVAWKRLELDIFNFLQQNITEEELKNRTWVQAFVGNSATILNNITQSTTQPIRKNSLRVVEFVEDVFVQIGRNLPENGSVVEQANGLTVMIISVNPSTFDGYKFSTSPFATPIKNVWLPESIFQDYEHDRAVIVGMAYTTLPAMRNLREHYSISEKVLAVTVNPPPKMPFKKPLLYKLEGKQSNFSSYECVFWNDSFWDSNGCVVSNVTGNIVTCECNHMTSFSVLTQVADFKVPAKHRFILGIITYIGCGVSIAACILLILTYMLCGRLIKVDRNIIHINLALAIAIANSLFLCADTVYKYKNICFGVSIGLFYSYLAAFFWMLVEGIHVYLMIVKVFKSPKKIRVYMIIGWIIPGIIVVLTAFRFHNNFTREDFCWLPLESNIIWIFVGPVLAILLINSIILIATLNASHKMSVDETEFSRLQRIARLTLLLMPIFGLTWVFGIIAVNKQLLLFQYIFTGINSFQGLFIFICYCVINNEVRREYQKVRRKSQYSSSSKSNGFSDNGFSTYIHPYPRNKRIKSALSMEDNLPAVQLTRFDISDDIYPTFFSTDNHREPSENFSDTLTKRHKKQYSIELVRLQTEGLDDRESVCSLIPNEEAQYLLRTSTFDGGSRIGSDCMSSNGEDPVAPYKTFHNMENGVTLNAYRV